MGDMPRVVPAALAVLITLVVLVAAACGFGSVEPADSPPSSPPAVDSPPSPEASVTTSGQPAEAFSSECDPNYGDLCVPVAIDVDCFHGSGDGPEYLVGQASVRGTDIYGLDRDGNGIACDSRG